MARETGLEAWHRVVRNMSAEALDEILAEDVVFHSPVVHTPQRGRDLTRLYLMAAFNVFPGDPGESDADGAGDAGERSRPSGSISSQGSFEYVREVAGPNDAVLEFRTEIDGIVVNGVDMIRWNDEGKIVDFKVMVRPLKAIQKVHAQMARMLEVMKTPA
ncbi:MAG TPA: nuclear transport factor 2 family protein [Myxococcota bacterium]|nr:nuclear transport factor 2 family protein [Myxococcota bacterium]